MADYLGITFRRAKVMEELYSKNNHIITAIEELEEAVDVYDLEIKDTHNFIANELCVHNSSSNPNFQQLPKKSGKLIRSCIIPKPGHCLVAADYAGQEIRILAAYSNDKKLVQAYNPFYSCYENKDALRRCHLNKGTCPKEDHSDPDSKCNVLDIHSYITAQLHPEINIPVSQIKGHDIWDIQRTLAKAVTFTLCFAGGAWNIAEKNNIPIEQAQKIVDNYFSVFPGVKLYIDKCQQYVDKYGYIEDMVARSRRFKYAGYLVPEHSGYYESWMNRFGLRGCNPLYRGYIGGDRRAATNHPIQALAASMTKIGAIKLAQAILDEELDAEIIEFIHDEILITCRKDKYTIERIMYLMRKCMVDDLDMAEYCIPNHPLGWQWPVYLDMDIELKIGNSYGSLKDPKEYFETLATLE